MFYINQEEFLYVEERANRDLRRCNDLQVAEYASSLQGVQEVHLNVDHAYRCTTHGFSRISCSIYVKASLPCVGVEHHHFLLPQAGCQSAFRFHP